MNFANVVTIKLYMKSRSFIAKKQNLTWSKPTNFDEVESFGILAGEDNGKKIFVGRAVDKEGNFVPAKVVPSLKTGFYVHNGVEEESNEIDFLDNATDYHWVKAKDANIDDAAVLGGAHIGRGNYNGNVVVGKIDDHKKVLVGAHDGKAFELPSYDVLIYKSKGVVYETIKKASNYSKQYSSTQQASPGFISNIGFEKITIDHNSSMLSKIRHLESERLSFQKNQQSYEERLHNQQLRINELSYQIKKLRVENLQFSKEKANVEEKFDVDQQKLTSLELKLNEAKHENSYLLKRITSLEEATQFERQMVESFTEKFSSSDAYCKSLLTKTTNLESTNRTLQNRVFELESEISMTTSNSEFLLKRVADSEAIIKNFRIQLDTYIKKLELSKTDNEFLIQKLTLLSNTLRAYQGQIECLTNKLQESKSIIASTHSELSRANAQIAKYQAAISACYTLNGELMSKVSAMNVAAQNQVGSDCSFNLVNYSSTGFTVGQSIKAAGYGRTATLLELTGSDLSFQTDEGIQQFQPFAAADDGANAGYLTSEQIAAFKPYERFTPFTPYAEGEIKPIPATNGFTEHEPAEYLESM